MTDMDSKAPFFSTSKSRFTRTPVKNDAQTTDANDITATRHAGCPVNESEPTFLFRETVSGKYFWLLAAMILMMLVAPLMRGARMGLLVTEAANAFVLLGAIYAIMRTRRHVLWALGLVLPAAGLKMGIGASQAPAAWMVFAMHGLLIAFLFYVTAIILRDILSERRVTTDTVKGAICVYLLMGLIWAMFFSLCAFANPESFALQPSVNATVDQMAFHQDAFGMTVYYSLVTLTTLGYGDITPMAATTRSLSSLEAVLGQIYLTVLVARLVGMHISTLSRAEP